MLVIAALIVGGSLGGIVGMLFAVPVAAFLRIQFDKIIDTLIKARTPQKSTAGKRKKTRSAAKKRSTQA
jgi:predicted PurR-regulated permease PerM